MAVMTSPDITALEDRTALYERARATNTGRATPGDTPILAGAPLGQRATPEEIIALVERVRAEIEADSAPA